MRGKKNKIKKSPQFFIFESQMGSLNFFPPLFVTYNKKQILTNCIRDLYERTNNVTLIISKVRKSHFFLFLWYLFRKFRSDIFPNERVLNWLRLTLKIKRITQKCCFSTTQLKVLKVVLVQSGKYMKKKTKRYFKRIKFDRFLIYLFSRNFSPENYKISLSFSINEQNKCQLIVLSIKSFVQSNFDCFRFNF